MDDLTFFIITTKPEWETVEAGRLCYTSCGKYAETLEKNRPTVPVVFMTRISERPIQCANIEQLDVQSAELLQALGEDSERLKWFKEKEALETAKGLTVDTQVWVVEKGQKLRGIIRYIGPVAVKRYPDPILGTFFGIELQGQDKGKGNCDGQKNYNRYFTCKKDCGVFAPFSKVTPAVPTSLSPSVTSQAPTRPPTDGLTIGDRVTFYSHDNDNTRQGMVMNLEEREDGQFVLISTDTDENGRRGGEVCVPLECVIKEDVVSAGTEAMDIDAVLDLPKVEGHPLGLGVGSRVEVDLATRNGYGTIRWVGILPGRTETMAGLELEEKRGVRDGMFKGERYFHCPDGKSLFVKLLSCRPDTRLQNANNSERISPNRYSERSSEKLENVAPISADQVDQILIGRMRGIQGHHNSCYMDAALFSLFSCSSALDSLLFKATEPQDAPIQNTLLYDIVIPLRSKGFVEGRHIMKLRQQLQDHGYSHSFTTEEKDPEEFLTVMMHHILALEPLLKLSLGGKVQESYCYQIFLDQSHSLVLPTVQQLLEHSLHGAGLKLAELPSCLILQMPRFGKKFKMFDKIIPSLELDITDLTTEGPQQCVLCGQLAEQECLDCFTDPVFSNTGFKLFCVKCLSQVHAHPKRRSHKTTVLQLPKEFSRRAVPCQSLARDKLELFAVLCIETSHYVSFIKYGPNKQDWIFFDSMADRQGELGGYNIPEVQACPEVGIYLDMSPGELANQVPRDMKGVAKRLFCDAYMYLYQSATMCLYR